jgi:hypothetical protein
MIEAEGCVIEHSPPETPEMNGDVYTASGQSVFGRSGFSLISTLAIWMITPPDLSWKMDYTLDGIDETGCTRWDQGPANQPFKP